MEALVLLTMIFGPVIITFILLSIFGPKRCGGISCNSKKDQW